MGECESPYNFKDVSKNWLYTKKKTYGYKERNEEKRQEFQNAIKDIPPEKLVYLDESGIDDNETYPYGWGPKGSRVYGMKNGNRRKRLSIIGTLNQKKIKAPFVFEGSCNRQVFEVYLDKVLIPCLEPGQTVVLDNASFHKGGNIINKLKKIGVHVLYLPAYSPDFNPIENYWSPIKHWMRKQLSLTGGDLYKAADLVFNNSVNFND